MAVCSDDECGYETIVYPASGKQKSQWACGYKLPEYICPECTSDPDLSTSALEVVV